MRAKSLQVVVALILTAVFAGEAGAQVGRVNGLVKDDSGNPIKGATVTADNPNIGPTTYTATTDDKGRFTIIGLRAGQWRFTAQAPGHAGDVGQLSVRFGSPNSLGVLFFDNYDTRFSGFETLNHAVAYRNYNKGHLQAEGAFVLRIQELSEEGLNLAGIDRILKLEARLERAERRAQDLADELRETRERHREELAAARGARGAIVPVCRGSTALTRRHIPVPA